VKIKRACVGVWGILCVVLILVPRPSAAQELPLIEQLAIQLHEGGFSLYNVDSSGQFSLITTLTNFNLIHLAYSAEAAWEIDSPSDFALSPDGQHIAFTSMTRDGDTALFLYTLGQTELHQVAAPAMGVLKWSPANDAILLAPPEVPISYSRPYVQDVYLYTLASDRFTNLTNTPEDAEEAVTWLPDGNHILYAGPLRGCGPTCTDHRDLYLFDRSTQSQSELVDLGTQLPAHFTDPSFYYFCYPHNPVWSTADQRIYYAASCVIDPGEDSVLSSVDLQGNNRLEVDLTALYPDDNYSVIADLSIHPGSGHIYLLVNSRFYEAINTSMQEAGRWHVFTNRTGQWDLITEADQASPPGWALAVSPDEQRVAVGGQTARAGFLSLADLSTGQVSTQSNEGAVCQVQWRDNDTLLHTGTAGCGTGYSTAAITWMLDIHTGDSVQMTGGLDGVVWLLPKPDVEPTNISPEASAGPDQFVAASETDTASVSLDGSGSADSDSTIEAYRWYENDTLIAEGITPQVELGIGEHTIVLTVVDDDGAIDWDEVIITVEPAAA
jgi:hypothetical protein